MGRKKTTNFGPCKVQKCGRPARAIGLCMRHYLAARRGRTAVRRPANTSGWTPERIAWVAGLLEGEGHFRRVRGTRRVVVKVAMTDEDVLLNLQGTLGIGRINGPYANGQVENHKPIWCWTVGQQQHVLSLCRAIYPLMGERRRGRISLILDLLSQTDQ